MGKLFKTHFGYGGFSSTYFQERIPDNVRDGYESSADLLKLSNVRPSGSKPQLKIVLLQKPLFIQDTDLDRPACVLRGYLLLRLSEPTKFTEIALDFGGKLKTCWMDNSGEYSVPHAESRPIIEHRWTFLRSTNRAIRLDAGDHQYDFELVLPGALPETVHTHHLSVVYKLRAVARRPGFRLNLSDTEYVAIKRQPSTWSWTHLNSVSVTNIWNDLIQYEVFLPIRSCTDDESVDVSFKFLPMDPIAKVLSARIFLKEYAKYQSPVSGRHKDWSHIISQTQSGGLLDQFDAAAAASVTDPASSGEVSLDMTLDIPTAYARLQYDTTTPSLEVSHKIKCVLQLRDRLMQVHTVCIAIPFVVCPKTMEGMHNLPAYDTLEQHTTRVYSAMPPPSYETAVSSPRRPTSSTRPSTGAVSPLRLPSNAITVA
ncbi:hypothetical protein IWQ60_009016 [Tieghemiomyces parasiticus]|uniref:Arrestin-like N-terminal domain-containing protein n=1 Tax=Tieghemiomyces parasiticus TaxID=78921 RepID=A0A9W8DQW5_9FUNG|nr:hypothetical protein IWQ60_009016 [Tieghemiomyces parasiticus]